jgi:hypothetical protein
METMYSLSNAKNAAQYVTSSSSLAHTETEKQSKKDASQMHQ